MELNMCKSVTAIEIQNQQQEQQDTKEKIKEELQQQQQEQKQQQNGSTQTSATALALVEQKEIDCKELTELSTCVGGSSNTKSSLSNKQTTQEKKNDEKIIKESTELLGSVTTHNCPGTRTSARVIQKMKQDQTRPLTPPPNERDAANKKDERSSQKTPSQVRTHKTAWTNLERNYFFDALNEFGKDFEALGNCINSKLKRRTSSDHSFKTKDQVRQHYYQTYHKICKYIRFSEEIKKPAQELYALINYGEMRRKLQFLTEKHFIKLRQLIYQGQITVRCKGKNIRIKTPSCKALRRLNQLDDSLEDIRLPAKIEVLITPANMESFGRVQCLAQNPRVRTIVPLHKKLVYFLKTFQYKWRSHSIRLAEEELKLFPPNPNGDAPEVVDAEQICFQPKAGVQIHRPLLSITEYLSSVNLCLSAYEERMGVKVRSESLYHERSNSNSSSSGSNPNSSSGVSANTTVSNNYGSNSGAGSSGTSSNSNNNNTTKRQRTESGSDKRSPEMKKTKLLLHSPAHDKSMDEQTALNGGDNDVTLVKAEQSSGDELSDELNDLLMETHDMSMNNISGTGSSNSGTVSGNSSIAQARNKRSNGNTRAQNFKPLLSDDVMARIRNGWTIANAADITIGDLYVVLGQDSKLELEYYWREAVPTTTSAPLITTASDVMSNAAAASTSANSVNVSMSTPLNTTASSSSSSSSSGGSQQEQLDVECTDSERVKTVMSANISNKLKHLLLIASLSERVRKRQCVCGHSCERNANKTRLDNKQFIGEASGIQKPISGLGMGSGSGISTASSTIGGNSNEAESIFRQPMPPIRRPIVNLDPVKQLTTLTRQKMSRQVVVQRRLLPTGRAQQVCDATQLGMRQLQTETNTQMDNNAINSNSNSNSNPNPNINVNVNVQNKGNAPATTTLAECMSSNLTNLATSTTSAFSSNSSHNNNNNNKDATTITNNDVYSLYNRNNANSSDSACTSTNTSWLNEGQQQKSSEPANANVNATPSVQISNYSMPSLDFVEETMLTPAHTSTSSAYDDDESTTANFFNENIMMSPMHLIRDSTSNSRWLEENLNDFSLTSLLGHLDEINSTRDILDPSSNMSVISESSVDYRHKFQEITALMQSQEKD